MPINIKSEHRMQLNGSKMGARENGAAIKNSNGGKMISAMFVVKRRASRCSNNCFFFIKENVISGNDFENLVTPLTIQWNLKF
jgi:hypothetical protein